MIEATTLPAAWQVSFRAGGNEGLADTVKNGTGGSAGMRPHELLEASLATCMTISARMALADLGLPCGEASVRVRVHLERKESGSSVRAGARPHGFPKELRLPGDRADGPTHHRRSE